MKHVTSRKAHRGWEGGGKGQTDGSLHMKGALQKDSAVTGQLRSFLAPIRISREIWQVGFHPKAIVCVVCLRNCSDFCDAGRGSIYFLTDETKYNQYHGLGFFQHCEYQTAQV